MEYSDRCLHVFSACCEHSGSRRTRVARQVLRKELNPEAGVSDPTLGRPHPRCVLAACRQNIKRRHAQRRGQVNTYLSTHSTWSQLLYCIVLYVFSVARWIKTYGTMRSDHWDQKPLVKLSSAMLEIMSVYCWIMILETCHACLTRTFQSTYILHTYYIIYYMSQLLILFCPV